MAFGDQFFQVRNQEFQFRVRFGFVAAIQQGWMTGRLTKSQQRFQHVHFAFGQTVFLNGAQQRFAIMDSQFVVQSALLFGHIAVNGFLKTIRKF